MANDKDFILKNAIEVGGSTKVTIGSAPTVGSFAVGYTDASLWAYANKSFSVTSQETDPAGFAFKSDGTKMYLIGRTNDTVYQYSLSTAWDVSTSSYDSVSFLASSQITNPSCLILKPDGTKMYLLGYSSDAIFQYSLSTAFDLSTVSYDSVTFSVYSQESTPRDFRFNADGTKIFLVGSQSDKVHQYSLSTAYNIGTASYDSVFFSTTGQTIYPAGVDFNADASKMYIFNNYNGIVYQYSLPSAYDIANAVYDSVSFTVTQDTNFSRVRFSDDGTSLYVAGTGNDTVYQYSTGSTTATNVFDVSTGNYFATTPSVSAQYDFSNAGDTQTWQLEVTGNQVVVGYDLANAAYASKSFSVNAQDTIPQGVQISYDGTKIYIVGSTGDDVNEYNLSTAFDVSTASYSQNFSISSQTINPSDLFFKPDGTKMYIISNTNPDTVFQYSLSTAWDIGTASYDSKSVVVGGGIDAVALSFKPDGTKMYCAQIQNSRVDQFSLSTAWDVSTATSDSLSGSFSSQESYVGGFSLNNDGTKAFVVGLSADTVFQYSLSTAYNISTMSYDSVSFGVVSQENAPRGLCFSSNGTTMFIVGSGSDTIYQYTTGTTTGITITWDADIKWAGGTAPDSPASGEKDLYTITTDDAGTSYVGIQSGDNFS